MIPSYEMIISEELMVDYDNVNYDERVVKVLSALEYLKIEKNE